ncbi:alpha/beta fold hydrolase [Pseudonocardia acaciae]|uniref:alpha/beta fold hydrolase n=1 Tax=Pseudonocardia acaciae TaxID=551276 RepID=UPI00048CD6B1|nr:alpha/beta hydrolase [Pseudonocardia acaciae]
MTSAGTVRTEVEVDGVPASYLTCGDGPMVLLLHGTYWSRVWRPVMGRMAALGVRPVAVDLPGAGHSGGELTVETATVPELARWVGRFVEALGEPAPLSIAGHDIGGALAQHLLATGAVEVRRLALVNSVTYDSWPVPGVARYRDPELVAATSVDELLAARRQAVTTALGRQATEAEIQDYVEPWRTARVARSWMALAAAADSRYTLELVDRLRASSVPKFLIWGEDDPFQKVEYADRFSVEMPATTLLRIPRAGHIPMENEPALVGEALGNFFLE